jgi:hypothetical protein
MRITPETIAELQADNARLARELAAEKKETEYCRDEWASAMAIIQQQKAELAAMTAERDALAAAVGELRNYLLPSDGYAGDGDNPYKYLPRRDYMRFLGATSAALARLRSRVLLEAAEVAKAKADAVRGHGDDGRHGAQIIACEVIETELRRMAGEVQP